MLLAASGTAPVLDPRYGVQLLTTLMIATWVCASLAAALATGLALSAGLIAATGEVADVNDTRGLLILAAWRPASRPRWSRWSPR
jgi:hypothetical protein